MASRYGSFARAARSAFNNSHGSARSSFRSSRPNIAQRLDPAGSNVRRRGIQSMIPLHSAIASAKLVSHLSYSSRASSAFSLCTFLSPSFTRFQNVGCIGHVAGFVRMFDTLEDTTKFLYGDN